MWLLRAYANFVTCLTSAAFEIGMMSLFGSMMEFAGRDFARCERLLLLLLVRVVCSPFSSSLSRLLERAFAKVSNATGSTRGGMRVRGGIASKGALPVRAVHLRICL